MNSQPPGITVGQRSKPPLEDSSATDLQHLIAKVLSVLRYRRWLFVIPLLTGIGVVLAASLLVPRQYELRTVFERKDDPVLLKLVANSPYSLELQRQTVRIQMTGKAAVSEAIEQLGPEAGLEIAGASARSRESDKRELVARLASGLFVVVTNSNPNYDLIELRYTGEHPRLAEKVLPLLRDNYIRSTMAKLREVQQQAQQFFDGEVEKRRGKVARMQAELAEVLAAEPDVDPRRPEWLNERLLAEAQLIEQLNRQKHDLNAELQARDEYLAGLKENQEQVASDEPTFTTRPVESFQRQSLQTQIAQVMAQISDARTVRQMKDAHPHVESLQRKLEQLRFDYERANQQIAAQADQPAGLEKSPDNEANRVAMEIKALTGKLEQIELDIAAHQQTQAELKARKETVFERQQMHTLRQQELDTARADLGVWQSKLDEINRIMTAANLDRGVRFTTIEECGLPLRPSNPRLQSIFVFSAAVGLGLALAAVFVRELFDRSLRRPGRVRELLGVPVLEVIEEIAVRPSARRWLTRSLLPITAGAQTCLIAVLGWLVYVSLERPDTYARWLNTFSARLSDMRGWLT